MEWLDEQMINDTNAWNSKYLVPLLMSLDSAVSVEIMLSESSLSTALVTNLAVMSTFISSELL